MRQVCKSRSSFTERDEQCKRAGHPGHWNRADGHWGGLAAAGSCCHPSTAETAAEPPQAQVGKHPLATPLWFLLTQVAQTQIEIRQHTMILSDTDLWIHHIVRCAIKEGYTQKEGIIAGTSEIIRGEV